MLLDILKQFNWVDVLVIILLIRICYAAINNGFSAEVFKLLGTIVAIYLSLHYYTQLSDWLQAHGGKTEKLPLEFLDFLLFTLLVIVGYLIFVLLRSIFYRFIKMEAAPNLNKWGGLVLGIFRGYLLAGLVVFILVISSVTYLKTSVKNSYTGKPLFKVAVNTYSWLWNSITSKFMPGEKFNNTILEAREGLFSE
ncbi:MAG: CvpA family protein [Candidatus Omnitrophica bacterium]|nr:CvpA family protein [Candidatus Omnitrophota bacterium]